MKVSDRVTPNIRVVDDFFIFFKFRFIKNAFTWVAVILLVESVAVNCALNHLFELIFAILIPIWT